MIILREYRNFTGTVLLISLLGIIGITNSLKIYDNLIQCYRGNHSEQFTPNSLQILLELIRKIENSKSVDIRTVSINLIHRLRIDGIERANGVPETEYLIPYSPTGLMAAKFDILLKLISKTQEEINFNEILTPNELCKLHRLISSTIDGTLRGDESRVCPLFVTNDMNFDDGSNQENFRSKVHVYENGKFFTVRENISRCPIERGVIRTYKYGTLSPGTVIAAIAAGLQPQMVPIKDFVSYQIKKTPYENLETMEKRDTEKKIRKLLRSLNTIDNTYAAGLAGDLAEVCIYQAPYFQTNVSVGLTGKWNDIDYPRFHYLSENNILRWDMTDAEILGGIDGKHLSKNILSWFNRIRKIRLSQILELYYSGRGIPSFATEKGEDHRHNTRSSNYVQPRMSLSIFDETDLDGGESNTGGGGGDPFYNIDRFSIRETDSGCNRKQFLHNFLRGELKEQTYFMAQILQFSTSSMAVDDNLIRATCNAAVDRFFDYAQNLISNLPNCIQIQSDYHNPKIDLTLIIDGSRTKDENLKLLSFITEIIDVSSFGSYISIVHGTSGNYLVRRTNSIMNAFDEFLKNMDLEPTTLSLTNSFESILHTFDLQSQEERDKRLVGGISNVVLVISQSQKIRQDDFDNAKSMLEGSFKQFPDLYFVFVTNDVDTFKKMTASSISQSTEEQYKFIHVADKNPRTFSNELASSLRSIPKWLIIPDCRPVDVDSDRRLQYEDYISPNEILYYRINSHYLKNIQELRIQFEEFDYGKLTACQIINTKNYQCQSSSVGFHKISFNITNACNSAQYNCPNILFKIELDTSNMKCSENDCRFPDQVRFLIRLQDAKCDNSNGHIFLISHILLLLSFIICNSFVMFLN